MTTPPAAAGSGSTRLEVHIVVGPGAGAHLGLWARSLDASVRQARQRSLVGSVVGVVVDRTVHGRVAAPPPAPRGVEEWTVQRDRPRTCQPSTDVVLLADVATELSPSCLAELLAALEDPAAGIVEPRHIPFQSTKPLDLASGEVSWASWSCCLVRRQVLEAAGGLDLDAFPDAGADVDLSWKARLAGWSVRCATSAAAFDRTPVPSGEPLLDPSVGSSSAKLRLAARYAGDGAAQAWAKAWAVRGRPGERRAAADHAAALRQARAARRRTATDGTDGSDRDRAATDGPPVTDVFARELFDLHPLAGPALDRYDLSVRDLARTTPVAAPPAAGQPFLSVVVRTQGSRLAELEDNLLSLCAQSCPDFEVLVMGHDLDGGRRRAVAEVVGSFRGELSGRVRIVEVTGGGRARPLNVALAEASGRYLAFLDDDDVALSNWVATFREAAGTQPGAVVWSQVAWQVCEAVTCAGRRMWKAAEAPKLFVREFDLLSHLLQNGTTNCAIAVPMDLVTEHGLQFRENLTVFEDWAWVLRLAELAPFVPTNTVTALYRRGSADGSGEVHDPSEWDAAGSQVLDDLGRSGFFFRGEHMARLREALEELAELRREASEEDPADEAGRSEEDRRADAGARLLGDGYFEGRRVVVVGPHLDDAVLSCGTLLSQLRGASVLTVFAGGAARSDEVTPWDEACGFAAGSDVMAARLREDDAALARLGASAVRLPFPDEQYRDGVANPNVEEVGEGVLAGIRVAGAEAVFVPLGLGHGDHRLTAAACVWAATQEPTLEWFAYQDLPYAYEDGGVDEALDALVALHPQAVGLPPADGGTAKADAIACYASQVRGLGADRVRVALRPERYWRLVTEAPEGRTTSRLDLDDIVDQLPEQPGVGGPAGDRGDHLEVLVERHPVADLRGQQHAAGEEPSDER